MFEKKHERQYVYDILFANTNTQNVQTEIDCYWVKKMDANGDFAEVGEGSLDWPAIFVAAEEGGAQTYVVAQDVCKGDPLESIAISIANLRKWGKL